MAAVVVAAIEQALRSDRPLCVALGASNWRAIDNLLRIVAKLVENLRRLLGADGLPLRLLRIRGPHSPIETISGVDDILRTDPAAEQLAQELSAPRGCFVVAGTWMQLVKLAREHSEDGRTYAARWFHMLLLDEASQLPVSGAAAYFLLLREEGRVMLAGDHRQLGPIQAFRTRSSEQGLLDSIFSYMQDAHGVQATQLVHNYRTNAEIALWPRQRFYNNDYEAVIPEKRLKISLPRPRGRAPEGWPEHLLWTDKYLRIMDPGLPVVVITYPGQTYTLANPFEAQIAAALAHLDYLVMQAQGGPANPDVYWNTRLGVVTPHRAQVSMIRNLLTAGGCFPPTPAPAVDTVDRFQGQERDIIIASYSVADRDFVASEEEFILDPRRFNVTLTRARCKFVMLISDAMLEYLPYDAEVAESAAHLQLFVQECCSRLDTVDLPFNENGRSQSMLCQLRALRRV